MSRPIILSTWSFGAIANCAGWPILQAGGSALDAVEAACAAVDADLSVNSVGRGGTPDASGQVTLDGSIMLSPAKSAGVAAVRDFLHPVSIARQVMERTPHKLLIGSGAEAFAESCGFQRENLLTEAARQHWLEWSSHPDRRDQILKHHQRANREEITPSAGDAASSDFPSATNAPAPHLAEPPHDTVGVLAIDSSGTMAGACSTSGLPFKLPGRVGDSPIIGHGLYVDPTTGAAVATGNGELMMGTCASFLAVERMRQGDFPADALRLVLHRVATSHHPDDQMQCALIALLPNGQWATASLRSGFRAAITDSTGERLVDSQFVLLG